MRIALVTGAGGLIGSEAVRFFCTKFDKVIGIDNNLRSYFFGEDGSVSWNIDKLQAELGNYEHKNIDIRDLDELGRVFGEYGDNIQLIVHAAAQPSHDWAAKDPILDFQVNANGTINLLEMTRKYTPEAVFIFTSTNKVYGDRPNYLPLVELEKRFEIDTSHEFYQNGIDESMSIDDTKHSVFGASKVAADVMAQEYGKYFGMNVGIFRGGCLTGPGHSGAQLHGFLSYLMKCAITNKEYTIFGYQGKQVRDNIHSADLINMFWHFYQNPRPGEVYNAGGGRHSNCSILEAISLSEEITGNRFQYRYAEQNRTGDHIWWISDVTKFKKHYPKWSWNYSLEDIMREIYEAQTALLTGHSVSI